MTITRTQTTYNSETRVSDKTVLTYAEGATIRVWWGTVQVMSDIYEDSLFAEFWNEEKQCVQIDNWLDKATVDATPEVLAKAKQYVFDRTYSTAYAKYETKARNEARRIIKGSRVKVISGRTGKGLEGPVVVVIERPYGMGYRSNLEEKLAIAKSDVKVKVAARNGKVYENYQDLEWVWARNCELVEVPAIDVEEIKEAAKEEAEYEARRFA